MCGLAGFVNFKDAEISCRHANNVQSHRGPDHSASWTSGNVSLVHQRLSIIDLSERSNQPFRKNGLVIIFNGEIYNYEGIREILKREHGINFITTGDTEVVLEAYRAWELQCFDHFIGMFAFAIYDERTGEMVLARDHFGIKPLFFTTIENSFAFASELKTLVTLPGFDKTINMNSMVAALNYLWVPGHETMFRGSTKLPAGHYMLVNTREQVPSLKIERYWDLQTNTVYTNEEDAIRAMNHALNASIKRHMVADVPVSSFLSGGLDSSLVSVLAARINPRLSTYTIATAAKDKKVEQMPEDEKYARQLADRFGFDHHEIIIQPDIVKELSRMVYALDEPIGDPAAINTYLICKAAREKGVKVLLSGMGADEMFFGYRRQKALLIASRYKRIPGALRTMILGVSRLLPLRLFGKGIRLTRWARRFLSFASLPEEEAYMRSYSYYDVKELQALFHDDISNNYEALRRQHAGLFQSAYKDDLINQTCYTDIHMFMQGLNLTYTDRASMAASVEVRVPFIDKEMITLAMQIHGSLKYKNGESKYVLKKAAERVLPKEIIYRPKASFGAPIRSWISNELRPMVDELLSEENIKKRKLFNYRFVKKLIDEDRRGASDNAYRIYQLLTVELWLRQFTDQ